MTTPEPPHTEIVYCPEGYTVEWNDVEGEEGWVVWFEHDPVSEPFVTQQEALDAWYAGDAR